jgi:hypothetical protein
MRRMKLSNNVELSKGLSLVSTHSKTSLYRKIMKNSADCMQKQKPTLHYAGKTNGIYQDALVLC